MTTLHRWTVPHDDSTIALARGGAGPLLVLCPGMNTSQAEMHELASLLRREHDVVSFDLRGHGVSGPAARYCFDGFVDDVAAALAEVRRLEPDVRPVLVGYSLGGDLAVQHTARRPEDVRSLVLLDGAVPLPEPFVGRADLPTFWAIADDLVARQDALPEDQRARLTAEDVLRMNLEIDVARAAVLDEHRRIDVPTTLVASTRVGGDGDDAGTARFNRIWREGVERLVDARPDVVVRHVDADHQLVLTHAAEVARHVTEAVAGLPDCGA